MDREECGDELDFVQRSDSSLSLQDLSAGKRGCDSSLMLVEDDGTSHRAECPDLLSFEAGTARSSW